MNILIADDHSLIREGFKKLIDKQVGMKVVGEVEDGISLLEVLRTTPCDVLVLDLSMPGKNGLEVIKDVQMLCPECKILILTMHPEERYAVRCLKAGVAGYLTKGSAPKELVSAIEKVYNGGRYISGALAEKLAFSLNSGNIGEDHEKLSAREYEVFCLLASAKNATEIAEELSISSSTVNTYRMRIFAKMNISSVAEVVQYALRYELLD